MSDSRENPELLLPNFVLGVSDFMKDKTEYHGTPDELANELAALMDRKEKKVTNRNISRLLLQNITELSRRGIRFSPRRSNGKRFIDLYAASPRADSDDIVTIPMITLPLSKISTLLTLLALDRDIAEYTFLAQVWRNAVRRENKYTLLA